MWTVRADFVEQLNEGILHFTCREKSTHSTLLYIRMLRRTVMIWTMRGTRSEE